MIELLVVLSILAMMIALVLPAVQASREMSRRAKCANNLKQIALANHGHAELHRRFPMASGLPHEKGGEIRLFSAFTFLLPQLDRRQEYDAINFDVRLSDSLDIPPGLRRTDAIDPANQTVFVSVIETFLCPSDPTPPFSGRTGGVSYRTNLGDGLSIGVADRDRLGPFSRIGFDIGPRDVTDGLSNTAAFSERLRGGTHGAPVNPKHDILLARMRFGLEPTEALDACPFQNPSRARFKCCSGSTWSVGSLTQTSYNHWHLPNSLVPDCGLGYFMPIRGRVGARSPHPGMVAVAMGDGSVRPISDRIELHVWRALGTIGGREVVSRDL